MGRHSAPDDETVESAPPTPARVDDAAAAAVSRPRPGRHAQQPAGPADDARTDPTGLPPVEPRPVEPARAEPIVRAEPITRGGPPGKPRPGGPVRTAAARTGPPPREASAPPPRADDDTSPGLALIERAMTRPAPAEPAPEPAVAADETVQIEAIVDPVLDEPVPEAVTEKFGPVRDRPDVEVAGAPAVGVEQTGPIEPVERPEAPDPSDGTGTSGTGKPEQTGTGAEAGGRTSDLALLRSNSAVRARVAAAVVVPFLLYVSVLLIVDSLDVRTALIWIWIPLITAGVVGGLLLDIAHREAATATATEPAEDTGQRTDSPERTAP